MISRLAFALLLCVPLLAPAQDAFINRPTDLKERGEPGARTLARLSEETPVKVLAKAGGWTRVDAGSQAGWVNMFHLRYPSSVEASSGGSAGGNFLSSIGSAFTGQRANPSANLATTGVRNLSKEQLANASPNPEELRRMQSYRADRGAAERFAREGKLAAVQIDSPDEAPAPAASKGNRR